MNAEELARTLIAALPKGAPGLFNPWADVCGDDLGSNGPDAKLRRLQQHLDCDAEFILCGEAAGWQGMRHTGLAFTSERHVVDGTVPRLGGAPGRLTSRDRPFAEPSATLVWRALYVQGIAERVVMWNALPMHPHERGDPRSNRTPTVAELTRGRAPLKLLLAAFPRAAVVAVGKKAAEQLVQLGMTPAAAIRHPANGGARAFARGLEAFVKTRRRK